MNKYEERAKGIFEKMDRISNDIRQAEAALQALGFREYVPFGPICWDGQRIMMKATPLIEQGFVQRSDGHLYLDCLFDRVCLLRKEAMSQSKSVGA